MMRCLALFLFFQWAVPARVSAEPGQKRASEDPVVQEALDRLDNESLSESSRLTAAKDLKRLDRSRDKEAAVASVVDFFEDHRRERNSNPSKRDAEYAADRVELMEILGALAADTASRAAGESRRAPAEVSECLNALIGALQDKDEPWAARRKAAEMLAQFAGTAPAAALADTRRVLEVASTQIGEVVDNELTAKSWLSSHHPDRSIVEGHRGALKSVLTALGPLTPPAQAP
ncbi:MAG: hypothetical protein HY554_16625 [Elusimicrobia bacterium]|nr:hypothetical protein [Elusimicrobiota bacterium]